MKSKFLCTSRFVLMVLAALPVPVTRTLGEIPLLSSLRSSENKPVALPTQAVSEMTGTARSSFRAQLVRAAAQILQQRKELIIENLARPKQVENIVNEPSDLIDLVPVLKDIKRMIPKQFTLANHTCTVSQNQLIIEHHYDNIISKALPKNAIISLSYSGSMGDEFSTHLELPLAYKPTEGIRGDWIRYPVGNYTVTVNRGLALANQSIFLKAQTHF